MARHARRVVVATVTPATPQRTATAPPPKIAKPQKPQSDLIDALEFVSIIAKQTGTEQETHAAIAHNWVIMFNGLVACGFPIADDLLARPHTLKLLSAVKRAGSSLSITQNDATGLHLHAGKFRAIVPCLDFGTWPNVMPDPIVAAIDNRVKRGLQAVGVLASEGAQTVLEASVLLRNMTCVGTNRHVIFEFYHGASLPSVVLPKVAANMICKVGTPLVGIGFGVNNSSATFHFENRAWIRTQLYNEPWPDIDRIFASDDHKQSPLTEPPAGLWEGLDALEQFTRDDEAIFFRRDVLASHAEPGIGASYEVPGLPALPAACNPKYLEFARPWAKQIAFNPGSIYFQGDELRGVIALKTGS